MANKRTYEFKILAKIDEAVSAISSFSEGTQKRLDSINFRTGVSALKDGFEIIQGVADTVFKNVSRGIAASVAEAQEAEDANIRLANSLRLMGDLSSGALERFDRLGKQIQSTTKFSDDMVKSSVAVAKQFRLTNDETERVIRVAVDLAAATGSTLDEAVRKVSQTFNGFVDRDLAKVIPSLKNMGLQALVAGGAVEEIGKRVQGTAAAFGNTFSGALFRAQEAFKDILETLGNVIIQNPALIAGLNAIQQGFVKINGVLSANSGFLKNIVTDGFLLIIQSAPALLTTIQKITNNLNFLGLLVQKTGAYLGAFAALVTTTSASGQQSIGEALREDLEKLDEQFGKSLNASEEFFNPLIESTKNLVKNTTEAVNKARDIGPAYEQVGVQAEKSLSGVGSRMAELSEQFQQQVEKISRDPVTVGFDLFIRRRLDLRKEDAIALGVGLTSLIVKGAQGAQKLISSTIGAAADLLLPGIGGAVGEIVDVLSQGPEKTKEMVQGFARAIPQLIENLALSLPILIETLVRELPPALARAIPTVAVTFAVELIRNIPRIIEGFVQGLFNAAQQFVQALIDAVTGAFSGVGDFITGEGTSTGIPVIGGIIDGIGDIFGFADGGRTANDPRLLGDRGLVRIGPNEQTFNSDLTTRMERYLDNQEGGGGGAENITVQLVMNQSVLAEQMFKIRKAGFRT